MKKEITIIFLLLLISIPAVKSLFIPGAFTSHDLTHHIVRQISMDKILSEGQFPPRWSADLANGYGYPLFLFNYPLPALIGEIFRQIGLNFVDSVKAVLFTSLILSTLGMYLFLRSFFKSQMSAFLGAVFYLYAPIHLIVVYVSGAVGASMGLVFPPFIFWAIVKLKSGKDAKFLLLGSLSLAGLILSHNITALIFMPVILAFLMVLQILDKTNRYFLQNILLMFLLGLGLSVFFWLPAMAEKQFIRYDELMKGVYSDQFPSLSQIIYSPWGYGLSHPQHPEPGDMSYQIGLIHILVMLILLPSLWFFRKVKEFRVIGMFCLIIFISSVFFMLKVSLPFWDHLPFLPYIQFPVRILIVPIFSAALVAALLVKHFPWKKVLFLGLLFLVLYANRNHLNINEKFDPGEQHYLSIKSTTTSFDEDLPIWVTKIKTSVSPGKFSFLSGAGQIRVLENKSTQVLAEIEASSSSKIRFNQYYFPGWGIKIDGQNVNFNYQADVENSGLPVFDIGAGKHLVLAEFKNTAVRNLADFVSLLFVILWIVLLCKLLMQILLKIKKSS